MFTIHTANDSDLKGILELSKANLTDVLTPEEVKKEGFVTVPYKLSMLQAMNHPHPHIIAKAPDGTVAGYALVLLPEARTITPLLSHFFAMLDKVKYQGQFLNNYQWLAMGQICVAKSHRGQGTFVALYQKMKEQMTQAGYEMIVTEISLKNTRSLRAHQKAGFDTLLDYQEAGEDWRLVIWDWR